MILTPMRYKSYTWPHNPRVYSIDFQRVMAVNHMPFNGYQLQDLGRSCRVMKGEGEFVGEGAYAEFQKLACMFYEKGPGPLIHPLWQAADTYFVALRLEQAPRPDYVRYSFEFWEENSQYDGLVTRVVETTASQGQVETGPGTVRSPTQSDIPLAGPPLSFGTWSATGWTASPQPTCHKMAEGESLWTLSARYGLTIQELIGLNPQIKNPNLISVGQEVRVK